METLAPEFRTVGLIFLVTGPLQLIMGFLLARNPKFPSWTCVAMKYAGVGLMLLGALYYFQPWGIETTIHLGTPVILAIGALAVRSVLRRRNQAREISPR